MGNLVPSARTVSELLADSSEYEQEVREQVEGRWTKLTSHYIWLAASNIQTGIATLYRTAFARLDYIVECAFSQEVQQCSDLKVRCRKCRDAVNHSGTPAGTTNISPTLKTRKQNTITTGIVIAFCRFCPLEMFEKSIVVRANFHY